MNEQIIGTQNWWDLPLGRYMLAWEQTCYDDAVADIFGFHSLQMGLFPLQGLRCNRMPHRWLAATAQEEWMHACEWQAADAARPGKSAESAVAQPQNADGEDTCAAPALAVSLLCEPQALPFDSNSLDLVLLPHTLELSAEPHAVLREVARVLVPEGRVLISGINPASLWGMHTWSRRMPGLQKHPAMPDDHNLIGYGRLRDWLKLLDLELESASFGCYRPALRSGAWLARWQWLDTWGATGWPVLGGVYFVQAVKKVMGVRMLKTPWHNLAAAPAARTVATRGKSF